MPIHDWSKTYDGAFYNFHVLWIGDIVRALCGDLLPEAYNAMAEQVLGGAVPDVPLFLAPGRHVRAPLEATYQSAFAAMPSHLRTLLEPATH